MALAVGRGGDDAADDPAGRLSLRPSLVRRGEAVVHMLDLDNLLLIVPGRSYPYTEQIRI